MDSKGIKSLPSALPDDGVGVPFAILYIGKAVGAVDGRFSFQALQHRYQHGPGHRFICAEGGVAGAAEQALLHGEGHTVIEPVGRFHVAEGVCPDRNRRILDIAHDVRDRWSVVKAARPVSGSWLISVFSITVARHFAL